MSLNQEEAQSGFGGSKACATRIVAPGKNCLATSRARRAAVLVDGDEYFARLAQCLNTAHHSIIIIAWDFDAAIRLVPSHSDQTLGSLLRSLVDNRPDLHVHILVWSEATIHAPGATLPLLMGDNWSTHPRIHVRLDKCHPIYAAHHQKIVSIDDQIAFVGGMDLTVDRWDTPDHIPDCPRRVKPDGTPYAPVHDVQLVVEGQAARALVDIARERWRVATGGEILPSRVQSDAWPKDLEPQFEDASVAISTVSPRWRGQDGCNHSFHMTIDAIAAARNAIYIEAQYLTSRRVGEAIARSLSQPVGPEILIVVGLNSHGLVEQYVMARNRDRLARRLKKLDPHDRLRIYYSVLPSGKDLTIHSKVVVVDDDFLRIGSSNLNNRSEGLDTECDVSIEADTGRISSAIASVRETLLAEHLGTDAATVRRICAEERSLFRTVARLNINARKLEPLPAFLQPGPTRSVFGTWILDPTRPIFSTFWRAAMSFGAGFEDGELRSRKRGAPRDRTRAAADSRPA